MLASLPGTCHQLFAVMSNTRVELGGGKEFSCPCGQCWWCRFCLFSLGDDSSFFFFFFYPLPFDFVPILIHLWPLWQAASNSPLKGLSGWPLQDEGAEESPYCLDWDIRSYSIIIRAREEARQEETLSLGQEMSWGQPEKPFRPPLVTAPKYSASDIHF